MGWLHRAIVLCRITEFSDDNLLFHLPYSIKQFYKPKFCLQVIVIWLELNNNRRDKSTITIQHMVPISVVH